MTSVGTFEAKTHLTHLLERVAKGERIIITNRGKPVAMLVPLEADNERDTAQIGREMLAYRDRVKPPSAVRRFGTSLTRGTVTEKFALEPVSLVRGVAMTTLPPPDRFVLDGSVRPGNRSGQAPSIGTDRGNEAPGAT